MSRESQRQVRLKAHYNVGFQAGVAHAAHRECEREASLSLGYGAYGGASGNMAVGIAQGCASGRRNRLGDLALYGSTTALFDARARLSEALAHVASLRRLLATAELSCGPMKKHYLAVVDKLRKARQALAKFDRVDFDSAEQALVVRDARDLTARYNATLDEMLVIQSKLDASCSRDRQPIYRR